MAEKTKKLEAELFQVKGQLERTSTAKKLKTLGIRKKLKTLRIRKKLKTLGLRRETLKSLSRRRSIFVITMEQLDILDLITVNG